MPTKDKAKIAEYARRHYEAKREAIQRYRNERGCAECGEKHPAVLDLHHVDSTDKHNVLKTWETKRGRTWTRLSWRDLERELTKCVVLCSNCHRIEEARRRALAAA